MTWINNDGLIVKFGREEGTVTTAGDISIGLENVLEFDLDYTDVQATTKVIVGSGKGLIGPGLPENAVVESVDIVVETAFTSSGTLASATLELGLVDADDRSTDYDADGLTTTSFVGSALTGVGKKTTVVGGSTGAGSSIGVKLTENVLVSALNSTHGSNPYTAGHAKIRVFYRFN